MSRDSVVLRFLVDENLARLLKFLRMLGLDSLGVQGMSDIQVLRLAEQSDRVVLSQDHDMLKLKTTAQVYRVRAVHPEEQLVEVARHFQLWPTIHPLARCLTCNTPIESLTREQAQPFVPPESFKAFEEFFHCSKCKKVFWEGSHFDRMQSWLQKIEAKIHSPVLET